MPKTRSYGSTEVSGTGAGTGSGASRDSSGDDEGLSAERVNILGAMVARLSALTAANEAEADARKAAEEKAAEAVRDRAALRAQLAAAEAKALAAEAKALAAEARLAQRSLEREVHTGTESAAASAGPFLGDAAPRVPEGISADADATDVPASAAQQMPKPKGVAVSAARTDETVQDLTHRATVDPAMALALGPQGRIAAGVKGAIVRGDCIVAFWHGLFSGCDHVAEAHRTNSLALAAILAAGSTCSPTPAADSSDCAEDVLVHLLPLLHEAHLDVTRRGGNDNITPLIAASALNFPRVVSELVCRYGADLNAVSYVGMSPLVAALCTGSAAPFQFLLSRGAECCPAGASEMHTAVHFAVEWEARGDAAKMCSAGLRAAADADTVMGMLRCVLTAEPAAVLQCALEGSAPLNYATRAGDTAAMKLLLAHGADASAIRPTDRATPLMEAVFNYHLPAIQLLIAAGALAAPSMALGTAASRGLSMICVRILMPFVFGKPCGSCALATCGSVPARGRCSDGMAAVRTLLAAGFREVVDPTGLLPLELLVDIASGADAATQQRLIDVLRLYWESGCDLLALGPTASPSLLRTIVLADAPLVLAWLVETCGISEREVEAHRSTPWLDACHRGAWRAAAELLRASVRTDLMPADRYRGSRDGEGSAEYWELLPRMLRGDPRVMTRAGDASAHSPARERGASAAPACGVGQGGAMRPARPGAGVDDGGRGRSGPRGAAAADAASVEPAAASVPQLAQRSSRIVAPANHTSPS